MNLLKKYYTQLEILLCAFICLSIYVFYRSDHTLINVLIKEMGLNTTIFKWRFYKPQLPSFVLYNLPEALWMNVLTRLSIGLKLPLFSSMYLSLTWLPLLYAIGLEVLQYFHVTNGTFDWNDILFAMFFVFLARGIPCSSSVNKYPWINIRAVFYFIGYGLIFFSKVSY